MRLHLALAWVVIIAALHAIPGADLALFQIDDLFQLDKLFHVAVFSIGVFLSAHPAQIKYPSKWQRLVVVAYLLYGLLLEVLQGSFFSGRLSDPLDWMADAVGVFVGLWLYRKFPFVRLK